MYIQLPYQTVSKAVDLSWREEGSEEVLQLVMNLKADAKILKTVWFYQNVDNYGTDDTKTYFLFIKKLLVY